MYSIHPADDKSEILKQPVHTSVAIDKSDFEEFIVRDGLHVAINVKDFKAAVIHADSMRTSIIARYTRPCRPLQLSYISGDGINSEFTLMTRGDVDENDIDNDDISRPASQLLAKPSATRIAVRSEPAATPSLAARNTMPPPSSRPSAVQPLSSRKPDLLSSAALADIKDSLFVPADDDRQWDEQAYDEEEDQQDILAWNSNIEPVCFFQLDVYQQ